MSLMFGVWTNNSGTWGEEFADGATPGQDRITGYSWGTSPNMGERQGVIRKNLRWGLDWYKPDWVRGSHAFKIGADLFESQGNRARVNRKAPTYELVFANGVADFIEVQNTPVDPTGRLLYFSNYIHDTWTVGRKLTLNLGLRYAYDNGKVPATCREAANPPGDVANPAQCFDDIQFPVFPLAGAAPALRLRLHGGRPDAAQGRLGALPKGALVRGDQHGEPERHQYVGLHLARPQRQPRVRFRGSQPEAELCRRSGRHL